MLEPVENAIERGLITTNLIFQIICFVNLAVAQNTDKSISSKLKIEKSILLKSVDDGYTPEKASQDRRRLDGNIFQRTVPIHVDNSSTKSSSDSSHAFQTRDIKYYAATDVVEVEFKRTLLPHESLNELHKALLVHPFNTWKLRHVFASMKDIRIHEDKLQAVIAHPRNRRLKQKLHKVLRGEDVHLDVFGGSNTAGGGLKMDVVGIEGIYVKVIADWWSKTITPATGSNLRVRQIAIGGTSSDFFQYCFGSYIQEHPDLVFFETAVNDFRDTPCNASKCLPLEQLTRQLLTYPTKPALVYINLFSGRRCNNCKNLEDFGQPALCDTYNITTLRWRDAVCQREGRNTQNDLNGCDLIASDGLHINNLGHAHISLMLINLFRRILFDHVENSRDFWSRDTKSTRGIVSRAVTSLRGTITRGRSVLENALTRDDIPVPREVSDPKMDLPPAAFIRKATNVVSEPLCWTSLRPNRQTYEIKNNLDVIVTKNKGFQMIKNNTHVDECKLPCRFDWLSKWTSNVLGATTSLQFTVPARVSADGIKSRSVVIACLTSLPGGSADMWLDNDIENKKYVSLKLEYGKPLVTVLASRVEPGRHTLNIEIVKKGDVAVIALMIGPPDGPYC